MLVCILPLLRKTKNTISYVEHIGICNRAIGFDQRNGLLRAMSLRDQDGCAHRHPTMTSTCTMSVHLAPGLDGLQGGQRPSLQSAYRDREKGIIDGTQPEEGQRLRMRIRTQTMFPAHIDHQAYAQVMQKLVILRQRSGADEQVVRDPRKIHSRNLITGNRTNPVFIYNIRMAFASS
jgi:hypothetical protein